jgi:hypothetical protein
MRFENHADERRAAALAPGDQEAVAYIVIRPDLVHDTRLRRGAWMAGRDEGVYGRYVRIPTMQSK